ncbi:MAG: DUF4476 domain-containing protein, partial [Myxococcota bacterium]
RFSFGERRVALQVGLRWRGWWRNRVQHRFQRNFISFAQSMGVVSCGAFPNTMPPGSFDGQAPEMTPFGGWKIPGDTPQPTAPHAHPSHHDHPPTSPPPSSSVQMIPDVQARAFAASMNQLSYDSKKLVSLNNWLLRAERMRMKLRFRSVRRFVKQFGFDTNKMKAAHMLARHIVRPLKAAQVATLVRLVSFSTNKVKIAKLYCRPLADPLNIQILTKEFRYNDARVRIDRYCH